MKTPPANLRPRADIPNQVGFVLELFRADGSKLLCSVRQREDGSHYCATVTGKPVCTPENGVKWGDFVGWLPYVKPQPFAIAGYVAAGSPHLWTKDDAVNCLAAMGQETVLPRVSEARVLCFSAPGAQFPLARLTVHDAKSTGGKTLYACQFYAKAGA